jgi:VWFA-related protein
MSARYGGWIYLFCFSLVSGLAQQNRNMTLDVVVTDKAGRPVPGLEQKDFALLDNKQSQKIVSFQAAAGGAAAADSPVEVIVLVDTVNTEFTNVAIERRAPYLPGLEML